MKKILLLLSCLAIFVSCNNIAKIQKIQLLDIACDQKDSLLQQVYDNDRRIRFEDVPFKEFVQEDHHNLEIVFSIIGMSTIAAYC